MSVGSTVPIRFVVILSDAKDLLSSSRGWPRCGESRFLASLGMTGGGLGMTGDGLGMTRDPARSTVKLPIDSSCGSFPATWRNAAGACSHRPRHGDRIHT